VLPITRSPFRGTSGTLSTTSSWVRASNLIH
jgi:hypothetical protein